MLSSLARQVRSLPRERRLGTVESVRPGRLDVRGLPRVRLGDRVRVLGTHPFWGEVVGCDRVRALVAPFEPADGLSPGLEVELAARRRIAPDASWLGRVVDPLGRPLDGLPAPADCTEHGAPVGTAVRERLGPKIETGVAAIDLFTPLCRGQRLGLFAGSGVGKSVLLGMLTANADADAIVVGLVGERGRELQPFLDEVLGEARKRSLVIVATSDRSALMRREAAYAAAAAAQSLARGGRHVLLVMDSVTRFAMAGREIGLAAGEPPATRGYPPSVFADLPMLLEQAGPATVAGAGPITGVFTVLVEGGDHDEPVADAVRGILDGHVVLSRAIAERGRYPAIDILRSVSRSLPGAHSDAELDTMRAAARLIAVHDDVADLVRLGAYEPGSNPEVDAALRAAPLLDALLSQSPASGPVRDPWSQLRAILETCRGAG